MKTKHAVSTLVRGLLIALFALMTTTQIVAQTQQEAIGVVKDIKGETIIGASIFVKGTSRGTVTNIEGKFRLANVSNNTVLVITYTGYIQQEVPLNKFESIKNIVIVLEEKATQLNEVQVVAYGTQTRKTLTGALGNIGTEALLRSPNASVANTLAGQVTGVSTVQTSGQPGKEDPKIFVRGAGSLTDANSSPLILVDGVERSFYQMDPNEIESITVLKDASATAVFGVRGANGVILVTSRRGVAGKAKISVSSSTGLQAPVNLLETLNSYDMASLFNEMDTNDGKTPRFSQYSLDRYKYHDQPMLYPDINWREYLMRDFSIQTQNNVNISGGSERVKYFTSLGNLFQNGLMKDIGDLPYDANFKYKRFNYRTNLDIEVTKTTQLKLNIGGIVGDTYSPIEHTDGMWKMINWGQPYASPGIVDNHLMDLDPVYVGGVPAKNPLLGYWGKGYKQVYNNTLNLDLQLTQKLDDITKGLSMSLKGAYNSGYTFNKTRANSVETWKPYAKGYLDNPSLGINYPGMDQTIVYRVTGTNGALEYSEPIAGKNRDWYIEGALNYDRKFGNHQFIGMLLYNQSKKYYPTTFSNSPMGYVGVVSRVSYNYKSKYLAEFNAGYNGSENFAPGLRYGFFPAGSLGWVVTEENFMHNQKMLDYLKIRTSFGLVGNDKMTNPAGDPIRYMYLPDAYYVNQSSGYNFGYDQASNSQAANLGSMSNPYVTWETALKENIGIDLAMFGNKLSVTADVFQENRTGILINRQTVPGAIGLDPTVLPPVNLGEVYNRGFEVEVKWNQQLGSFRYWVSANVSFARNKIIYKDEIPPSMPYQAQTGRPTNSILGYRFDRFYTADDFQSNGTLVAGIPVPTFGQIKPGDTKYKDLNGDNIIDTKDQEFIGFPDRPEYVGGLNYGVSYKGWELSMNWAAATNRSVMLSDFFRIPGAATGVRSIYKFQMEERWTPETAATATAPRLSTLSSSNNYQNSDLWVRDGSYIRLKNVKLGYTFSNNRTLKKIGISQLNLFVTAFNPLTFDYLKVVDVESNPSANDTYPIMKIYNFGLNLVF